MNEREYQICTNCVMDTTDSKIIFDEKGVCDYCNNYKENIVPNWHPDEVGAKQLNEVVKKIKKDGKGKKYDCLIGISGGVDSSYLLYYAKEKLGLRPLAFAVDTGWNTNIAVKNVEKVIKELQIDLHTEVINWQEMRDLQLAYFKAQVSYQDTPQDLAIFSSLYNYAAKNEFKYIITGANYSTECVREPLEWCYYATDTKHVKYIHRRFGSIKLKKFPMCDIFKYKIYYKLFKNIRVVQPLNCIQYVKEDAIKELQERFGWEKYANKHFESIFTRFFEGYWLVKKFGYDKRRAHFSSLILTGQMTREEALRQIKQPPYDEGLAIQDLQFIAQKLGLTKEEFIEIMNQQNRSYKDYKSNEWLIKMATKMAVLLGVEKRNFR